MSTNFPNGVSSYGVPLNGNGIPATSGSVLFVNYTDGNDGVSIKSNSIRRAFKTVAKAYDMATTNKNDVIALVGNATHVLTEMLTVAKNRVHFVGLDCASRKYGQGAKISLGITGVATNLGTIKNTGIRNSFQNIKIENSDTVAQGLYTFLDAGEYLYMRGCELYKETFLTTTGAAELVANGDSAQFDGCTIGNDASIITGAIIRPNVTMTKELAGTGKKAIDNSFTNCLFLRASGHVNNRFIYGANADDTVRMLLIDNCIFFSGKNSTALPAQCVGFAAEQTGAWTLIRNCSSIGNTKISTTAGVYIDGPTAVYATSGIALAA